MDEITFDNTNHAICFIMFCDMCSRNDKVESKNTPKSLINWTFSKCIVFQV